MAMYEKNRPDQGATPQEETLCQAPLLSEEATRESASTPTSSFEGETDERATASRSSLPSSLASFEPEDAKESDSSASSSPASAAATDRSVTADAPDALPSSTEDESPCDSAQAPSESVEGVESSVKESATADASSEAFEDSDPSLEASASAPSASGREACASDRTMEGLLQGELNPPEDIPNTETLLALQKELALLQRQIQQKKEAVERLQSDVLEFSELYPDQSLSELPDEVWENVRRGVPIAAAFALSERRREKTLQKAEEVNRSNRLRSPGTLGHNSCEFFTAAEVRAMSPSEVHRHYETILRSMKSWS